MADTDAFVATGPWVGVTCVTDQKNEHGNHLWHWGRKTTPGEVINRADLLEDFRHDAALQGATGIRDVTIMQATKGKNDVG